MLNLNLITSTPEENEILNRIDADDLQYIELCASEREFLNTMILRKKPKEEGEGAFAETHKEVEKAFATLYQ